MPQIVKFDGIKGVLGPTFVGSLYLGSLAVFEMLFITLGRVWEDQSASQVKPLTFSRR